MECSIDMYRLAIGLFVFTLIKLLGARSKKAATDCHNMRKNKFQALLAILCFLNLLLIGCVESNPGPDTPVNNQIAPISHCTVATQADASTPIVNVPMDNLSHQLEEIVLQVQHQHERLAEQLSQQMRGIKDSITQDIGFIKLSLEKFSGGSVSQESERSHGPHSGEGPDPSGPQQWSRAMRLHQDLLKLHGVDPGFLLQPDDGNSDASGESTTCDSGRGGSEEDSHSTGRISPSGHATNDSRAILGAKAPRHLSTFHPSGNGRTVRCNPALLRHQQQPGLSQSTSSAPSPNGGNNHHGSTSTFTDNGQPVKKVSFHEDVTRGGKKSGNSPLVDRWQSPLLIGGVATEAAPPPAPPVTSSSHYGQYPSLNRHPYANVSQKPRIYSNLGPRLEQQLDTSLDAADDNTSTTTSGSYQVELDSLPFPPLGPRRSVDQNSVV